MDNNLKLIFSEILQGSSQFLHGDNIRYIKHLNNLDISSIDIFRENRYQYALSNGVSKYEDKLNTIISEKLWSKEKEREIEEMQNFLINLRHSKSKYTLDRDKQSIDKEIKMYEEKSFDLILERGKLIGKTAEQYAERKVNEYYLFLSIFKDAALTQRLFTQEDFDELDEYMLIDLLMAYNKRMALFNHLMFKKISLSPIFSNLFHLSDNDPYKFYGKPIIQLTFYQIEIFQHGKQFKYILDNSKIQPPVEIMNNPDKLVEWFDSSNRVDQVVNNQNVAQSSENEIVIGGDSIVGAKPKDYDKFGLDGSENKKIKQKLQEKGELSWADLM